MLLNEPRNNITFANRVMFTSIRQNFLVGNLYNRTTTDPNRYHTQNIHRFKASRKFCDRIYLTNVFFNNMNELFDEFFFNIFETIIYHIGQLHRYTSDIQS